MLNKGLSLSVLLYGKSDSWNFRGPKPEDAPPAMGGRLRIHARASGERFEP